MRKLSDIVCHLALSASLAAPAGQALADPPVIEEVRLSGGRLDVTLRHPDTGWDHYADVWRVYDRDGNLLAERILAHPHVQEQPFTRSVALDLPAGISHIFVVAGCTNGDQSGTFELELGGP